jgi:cytochrome b involved in lipid metabolism
MNKDESTANADKVAQTLSSTPDPNTPYTSSEVAAHNKKTNCWTIVENRIYNITKIIKEHPAIAEYELSCGIDGTSALKGKVLPTGEKDTNGIAAAQPTEEALKGLQVGKLKTQ